LSTSKPLGKMRNIFPQIERRPLRQVARSCSRNSMAECWLVAPGLLAGALVSAAAQKAVAKDSSERANDWARVIESKIAEHHGNCNRVPGSRAGVIKSGGREEPAAVRSVPVLGHRNVHKSAGFGLSKGDLTCLSFCARGRARSF